MTKIRKRIAALILTAAMTMSFVPLLGNQSAFAAPSTILASTLDVGSGAKVRLSGNELKATFAALQLLTEKQTINTSGQTYDLDKNGSYDLAVDNYSSQEDGAYSEFYMMNDNSCVGLKEYTFTDVEQGQMGNATSGVACSKLTIDFRKTVNEVNIQVESPICGVETAIQENTGSGSSPWNWDNQTNKPVLSIENSSEWVAKSDARWVNGLGTDKIYTGKFVGGTQYDAVILIGVNTKYKYADAGEISVKVNGVNGTNVLIKDDVLGVFGKADAVHNMDAGTVTQQPSVSSDGVKTYKCIGCGKVLKTEAVSNAAVKQAAYAPGQAALKKVKKGSKKATVTLKTMKNVAGYQIQFTSTKDGSVKTATVKQTKKIAKKKTVSKVVKGLAKKTRYTVQVRAYNVVNGEAFYGPWSNAKNVKIK